MKRWLQRLLRIRSPRNRLIQITPDAVALQDVVLGDELWRVPWDAVEEIVAFKVDAITVDHICLGFQATGSGSLWITDEETRGWTELNAELARRFHVVFEEWFEEVAFPAFRANRTVLWRRDIGQV